MMRRVSEDLAVPHQVGQFEKESAARWPTARGAISATIFHEASSSMRLTLKCSDEIALSSEAYRKPAVRGGSGDRDVTRVRGGEFRSPAKFIR